MADGVHLRQTVVDRCLDLFRQIELAGAAIGTYQVPVTEGTYFIMVPSDPEGKHHGSEERTAKDITLQPLFEGSGAGTLEAAWGDADRSVAAYMSGAGLQHGESGFVRTTDYVLILVKDYLERNGSLRFNDTLGKAAIDRLLQFLEADFVEVMSFVALEGFEGPSLGAFELDDEVAVRPVTEEDLRAIAWSPPFAELYRYDASRMPSTDWWVGDIRVRQRKGTYEGSNKCRELGETFLRALIAFSAGRFRTGMPLTQMTAPYGRIASTRGPVSRQVQSGGPVYRLQDAAVADFQRFWRELRPIVEGGSHYLRQPLSRLRSALMRGSAEDALTDAVIGMEALLSTADETGEIGYRFRIRGAVVLADSPVERRKAMRRLRDLYAMRSRVVHGAVVPPQDLQAAVQESTEYLRRIWRWFFERHRGAKNNESGVEEIDDLLIGPQT